MELSVIMKYSLFTPLNMVAVSHMWLLSIQNVGSETEELDF